MTRDDIIRMAREAGMGVTDESLVPVWHLSIKHLARFAALVAAAEREAAIDIVNDNIDGDGLCCALIIAAIRARGNK